MCKFDERIKMKYDNYLKVRVVKLAHDFSLINTDAVITHVVGGNDAMLG